MKKKRARANGEGTIFRRKSDGMWCATLTTGRREDGHLRRRTVYAKERERVVAKLVEVRDRRGNPSNSSVGKQKVGEYLTGWLEHTVRVGSAPGTYRLYKSTIDNHIRNRIGGYSVGELTPAHIRMMLADMEMDECGARTRKLTRDVLHKAFADIGAELPQNPVRSVKAQRVETAERVPLTVEQTRLLLSRSIDHRLHALLVVAAHTGLRQGELLALRWPDLDLPNRALHVRATLAKNLAGELTRKKPKTGKERVVPLGDGTVAVLERHQKAQMAGEGLREWVFPSRTGGPMDKDDLRRSFRSLLEDLELPLTRFHDLRHGFASMLAARGIDRKTCSTVLGHSTTRMTLDVYTHADADMLRAASDMIGEILRGA